MNGKTGYTLYSALKQYKMGTTTKILTSLIIMLGAWANHLNAQEISPYMGGEVELVTAPNGAIINSKALSATSQIMYLEPTTENLEGSVCTKN